jgi:hypothetical protein
MAHSSLDTLYVQNIMENHTIYRAQYKPWYGLRAHRVYKNLIITSIVLDPLLTMLVHFGKRIEPNNATSGPHSYYTTLFTTVYRKFINTAGFFSK